MEKRQQPQPQQPPQPQLQPHPLQQPQPQPQPQHPPQRGNIRSLSPNPSSTMNSTNTNSRNVVSTMVAAQQPQHGTSVNGTVHVVPEDLVHGTTTLTALSDSNMILDAPLQQPESTAPSQSATTSNNNNNATSATALTSSTTTNTTNTSSSSSSWPKCPTAELYQQHKRRRYFKIEIPLIPPEIHQAISTKLRHERSQKFWQREEKLKLLKARLVDQNSKIQQAWARLERVEQDKAATLEQIKFTRLQEFEQTTAQAEQEMTRKFQADMEQLEAQWKKELEDECTAISERNSLERKRKLEQQQEQQQHEVGELGQITNEPEKQESLNTTTTTTSTSDKTSGPEAMLDNHNNTRSTSSWQLKQEIDQVKMAVEKLTENRTEVIWLLKQIIKAEDNTKKPTTSHKPAPSTAASKQA